MDNKPHALILDDDPDVLKEVAASLSDHFNVERASTLDAARDILSKEEVTDEISVAVIDMRLPEGKEAGLTLIEELSKRKERPETIILTAYLTFDNVNKCAQAGAFGYIEKGKEDTYALLEQTCIQASKRWYRRHYRIFPSLTKGPVALLCWDVTHTALHLLDDAEEREAKRIIATFQQAIAPEVETHEGYLTKESDDNFVAVFRTVDNALQTALVIQRNLGEATSASSPPPLQFRASVHWGEMPQQPQERQEVERSVMWIGVKALAQATPGQVVLTQQAQAALRAPEGFQLEPLPIDPQQRTDLGEPIPLYTVHEPLPAWIQFALKAAQEIAEAGLDVPADLAEQHDFYAHGKRML